MNKAYFVINFAYTNRKFVARLLSFGAMCLVLSALPFEGINRSRNPRNSELGDCQGDNMFRRHFCSGFAFDSITFYSLLAIFNDSSETIRIKGMKDQLCAIFLASVVAFLVTWRGFPVSERERSWSFYFAVEISRLITFHLRTNQLFFCNFCGK